MAGELLFRPYSLGFPALLTIRRVRSLWSQSRELNPIETLHSRYLAPHYRIVKKRCALLHSYRDVLGSHSGPEIPFEEASCQRSSLEVSSLRTFLASDGHTL